MFCHLSTVVDHKNCLIYAQSISFEGSVQHMGKKVHILYTVQVCSSAIEGVGLNCLLSDSFYISWSDFSYFYFILFEKKRKEKNYTCLGMACAHTQGG